MAVPQRWLDTTTTKPECFRFKARITVRTPVNGNINNVEITVPLKYLSHFWRTLKISLLTENNTKLLQQWYSGFKRTVNHSKYLAKDATADPGHNLHYLVVQVFKDSTDFLCYHLNMKQEKKGHVTYYLLKVEIKDYSVKINDQKFFDLPVNN